MSQNQSHKIQDFNQYIAMKLGELWSWTWFKLGATTGIAIPTTLFGVSAKIIMFLIIMTVLDWITGIIKAKKNGEKITSKKSLNTGYKGLMYTSLILASFLVSLIFPDYIKIHEWMIIYLFLIEFHSVIENVTEAGIKLPLGMDIWLKKMLNTYKK